MSAKGGGPVFTFVLPGVKDRTTAPPSRQLQHCKQVVHAEEMDRLKLWKWRNYLWWDAVILFQ